MEVHRRQLEQLVRIMETVERMKHVCFQPENAAMMAIGGLKEVVPRRPEEVVEDLEATLKRTKTLGLRNAIRLSLRDLYRHLRMHEKALENLHAMLAENDEALQREHEMRREEMERREPRPGREP